MQRGGVMDGKCNQVVVYVVSSLFIRTPPLSVPGLLTVNFKYALSLRKSHDDFFTINQFIGNRAKTFAEHMPESPAFKHLDLHPELGNMLKIFS